MLLISSYLLVIFLWSLLVIVILIIFIVIVYVVIKYNIKIVVIFGVNRVMSVVVIDIKLFINSIY